MTGHHSHNPPPRSGLTLVEVVVVLTVIAVATAVVVPRWSASVDHYRASTAASQIVEDLQRAQFAAFNSSAPKTVTFSVSTHQYSIPDLPSLKRSSGPYTNLLAEEPYRSRIVSVWGQFGNQTITFDGYGLPSRGGNIVVASGGSQKTVVVDSTTGKASVQ